MFKHIILIIFFPILYIIDFFRRLFIFISHVKHNTFEEKCNNNVEDIVAVSYDALTLPDVYSFKVFYNKELLPEYIKIEKDDIKISKREFESIIDVIKEKNLINKKTYCLKYSFISVKEFISDLVCTDGGDASQEFEMYFKNGSCKRIVGFSEEMNQVSNLLVKIYDEKNIDNYYRR